MANSDEHFQHGISDMEFQLFAHADDGARLGAFVAIAAELSDLGMPRDVLPLAAAREVARRYIRSNPIPEKPMMTTSEEHIIRGEN